VGVVARRGGHFWLWVVRLLLMIMMQTDVMPKRETILWQSRLTEIPDNFTPAGISSDEIYIENNFWTSLKGSQPI